VFLAIDAARPRAGRELRAAIEAHAPEREARALHLMSFYRFSREGP
jgi:hypothetical protein